MTPLPKKKQSKARTGKRRAAKRLGKKDIFSMFSKGKGREGKRA